MSPDRHLPPWARVLGWVLCGLTYLLAGVVAFADVFAPSSTIFGVIPAGQITVSAALMVSMSAVGLIGVLLHRWRVEWVAASVLTFLLLARSIPVWVTVDAVPTRTAAAAMMVIAAINLGRRTLDLWVFYYNTTIVARRHDEGRRQLGRAEGQS